MRTLLVSVFWSCFAIAASGCSNDDEEPDPKRSAPTATKVEPVLVEQVAPPIALAAPPADATGIDSGVVYKTLVANATGAQPKPGDTVLIHYTGWIQRTGTTFFTTRARNQPMTVELAHSLPGFAAALPRLHRGERAILWLSASSGTPEAVVYEVELVDIVTPPAATKTALKG